MAIDIQALVEQADLLQYVQQYVDMHEDNGEWFGICPFHQDADPSFAITPRKNPHVFYCFGCGATGNIIRFVQRYHKVGFARAVELVKQYAGVDGDVILQSTPSASAVAKRFAKERTKVNPPHYVVLSSDFMQRYEFDLEKLQPWLDEGISVEALRHFDVMYSRKEQRIMFPLRNSNGDIAGVSGRTVDPEWKEKKLRKYTYVHKMGAVDFIYGLYENMDSILERDEIIIFEGAKSVMKCWSAGIKNVGAVLTNHLNPHQLKILIQLGIPVVFAFDKGTNIRKDERIQRLKQFCPVFYIEDATNLLDMKDAPVDRGMDIFWELYEQRRWLR